MNTLVKRCRVALPLFILAAICTQIQLGYVDWPPNRDITTYAVIGHEMVEGRDLYSDLFDNKPPAIYWSFVLAERLFGYGSPAVLALSIATTLAILFGLFALARASRLGDAAGLWAAGLWTALSGDLALQLHGPNTEAFMNACVLWAFALLLPGGGRAAIIRALGAGLLFALASFYKPVIVAIPAALGVALVLSATSRGARRAAFEQVAVLVGVGALAWLGLIGWLYLDDRLDSFYGAMVLHNAGYAGDIVDNLLRGFTLRPVLGAGSGAVLGGVSMGVMLAVSIVVAIWDRRRRALWVLLLAYGLGAFVAVCLSGKFYAHYFQLVVPPVLVALSWGTVALAGSVARSKAWIPHAALGLLLLLLAGFEFRYFQMTPQQRLPGRYAEIYLSAQQVGVQIDELLAPDEGVFQWGEESGIYFSSGRRTPSQAVSYALTVGAMAEELTQRTLRDLERDPPELVLIARYFARWDEEHAVLTKLREKYALYDVKNPRTRRYFEIRIKRGGSLERRIAELRL